LGGGNPALSVLSLDGCRTTATWSRSSTAPELGFVSFEIAIEGGEYSLLAPPARTTAGWQLTGLSLPLNRTVSLRARGRLVGGSAGGSSGLEEVVQQLGPPLPPAASKLFLVAGERFEMTFTDPSAPCFDVWAATNLALPFVKWDRLGSPVTLAPGRYHFTDADAKRFLYRFYRLAPR
jgi:hypothetical protein